MCGEKMINKYSILNILFYFYSLFTPPLQAVYPHPLLLIPVFLQPVYPLPSKQFTLIPFF
jgi:hypothetical protein